ncbi:MAG: protein kinase [Gemmatimonadaceae bacterium]|nr:protein kinase [Gemmatimonadaceae bacterium]
MPGTGRPSPAPPDRRTLGLTGRVFLGTATIVAVVIAAAFVITSRSVRRAGEASARRGLEQSADLVAQFLAGRSRSLAGGARVFVQGPYFRTLVAEQRRDDILDQSFEAAEQLGADWVFITDERGVLLAKSDEPGANGITMGSVPLVAGALRGLTTSGFGVSRDSLLFQAVGVPIVTPGGAPVGVLVATRVVDSMLVRDVKATTSSELLFYVHDPRGDRRVTVSTLGRAPEVARAVTTVPERPADDAAPQPDVAISGVRYMVQGSALTTAGGDVVGGFVVLRSREAELTGIAGLRRSLAVAGILGLLLSWLAAFVAARWIARPVRTLAAAVRRAADGEYVAGTDAALPAGGGGRELEDLGAAFSSLLADLRDKELLIALQPPPPVVPPATAAPVRGSVRSIGGSLTPRAWSAPRAGIGMEPGAVLANRYRIESVIGSGGLGIVYRAHDRVVGESVAVKVLRPEVLALDAAAPARLAEELRIARRISHRNVVRVHDIGEADGITFLTMELVEGVSLQTLITTHGALPPAAVTSLARQLSRALAVMHADGVAHGDLKPANLLLAPGGVLKVSDFGIARVARGVNGMTTRGSEAVGHLAGAVIGTPEYMAPEQLIGGAPTPASDIYAAGVVLHECLHGTTPFDAETRLTFLAHKLDATPVAPVRAVRAEGAGLLDALIARMMAPAPDARPRSASALFTEFSALD